MSKGRPGRSSENIRKALGKEEFRESFLDKRVRDMAQEKRESKERWMKGFVMGQLDCKEKILMKEGVWQVGVEDRPKGWEDMGGKEQI
jgi:hypothetical protein